MIEKLPVVMRKLGMLLVPVLLLSSSFAWAQMRACDLSGTWYGGGEVTKYLLTLTPRGIFGDSYNLVFNGAYSMAKAPSPMVPIPVTTPFTGVVIRNYWGSSAPYIVTFAGMMNTSDAFPAPTPQVWALHATAKLTDCNTLEIDYDFFGAYLMPMTKVPFVDQPDYVPVPPPFTETYKRVPVTCSICKAQ